MNNNIQSIFTPLSPIQDLIGFLDESNFTSLSCTCKAAAEVRKDFTDPRSGFHTHYSDRADAIRQTICLAHISRLIWSLEEAWFTAPFPFDSLRAIKPVFFSIHRMLLRPGKWDVSALERVYGEIVAYDMKLRTRNISLDNIIAMQILKTRFQAMIHQRPLTDDEMDVELNLDGWQYSYDKYQFQMRERLDLGFCRGPLLVPRESMRAITMSCGGSNYTSNLSFAMMDLEKRIRRGRMNSDISMATELAETLSRMVERAIFYGYADTTLRVFDRAIDLVFPM